MSETMESRDRAAIHPLAFWTEYTTADNGDVSAADWVRWVKKGDATGATTAEKIARVQRDVPVWEVLRPFYEAWKRGQEAPVDGVPLDAAPFVTREMARALAARHIRSVEDLAAAEDHALAKFNIPGIRAIQQKARAYLETKNNLSGVTAELAALREQVAQLQAEKAEALATADAMAEVAGRPRRGRPPKDAADAA